MADFTMDGTDGREMFIRFAEKIMRGEMVVTHFDAYMEPSMEDRRYSVFTQLRTWEGSNVRVKIKATEAELGRPAPPVQVTMPVQVRELIFDDEPAAPVFDEDLK